MMGDPAGGVSMEGMLNSVISESTWGYTPDQLKLYPISAWDCKSDIPSSSRLDETLSSFGEFLENQTGLTRTERKVQKVNFTNVGYVGEKFRNFYEVLLKKMISPSPFGHGSPYYTILPAFFTFINEMESRGLDFRIIFRTFGHDAQKISEEYNSFCGGTHPEFSPQGDFSQRLLNDPTRHGRIRRSRDRCELLLGVPHETSPTSREKASSHPSHEPLLMESVVGRTVSACLWTASHI
jgi:hypothetical protein